MRCIPPDRLTGSLAHKSRLKQYQVLSETGHDRDRGRGRRNLPPAKRLAIWAPWPAAGRGPPYRGPGLRVRRQFTKLPLDRQQAVHRAYLTLMAPTKPDPADNDAVALPGGHRSPALKLTLPRGHFAPWVEKQPVCLARGRCNAWRWPGTPARVRSRQGRRRNSGRLQNTRLRAAFCWL